VGASRGKVRPPPSRQRRSGRHRAVAAASIRIVSSSSRPRYLAPDLVFVRRERRGIVSERGIEAAPDLVVEVLSPSTAKRDRALKRDRYFHFGVPEYWILDAEAGEVVVHRIGGNLERPEVHRDVLRWRPWPGAPELHLGVPEILRGLDD